MRKFDDDDSKSQKSKSVVGTRYSVPVN